jgi:uncharacterized protein YndB with AHSA1/START domain
VDGTVSSILAKKFGPAGSLLKSTGAGMGSDTVLQINKTFTASREKVFQAWTKAEFLTQWFAPSDDFATEVHELDVRVGGRYRVQMKSPEGRMHTVGGTYREIVPSKKLVFTWAWEEESQWGETVVTLEFHDLERGTELILTQEMFPSRDARDEHNKGWTGCLNRLAQFVA